VARELRSNRILRLWQNELKARRLPPYSIGSDCLFVAYFASAELGCHLALGWPMPTRILDLFTEFKCQTAGLKLPAGAGLLGAMAWYGLDAMDATEKDTMRDLILRGGPWSARERQDILAYCELDVDALARLLPKMESSIDLPRALLRGRYMAAVANMEWHGVPIDVKTLTRVRQNWHLLQDRLIAEIDKDYGVFDGRTFKEERWALWLSRKGIPWPMLESGSLALDDNTFRDMARGYPEVALMRELRVSLSQMRLADLAVGADGRNRTLLSPFGSKTSRNTPSNARFIFGPAVWLRCLIKPARGRAIAYVDWSQQEFGIAAALSGDKAMMDAYASGDPYLTFGKQAGMVPSTGTKVTHEIERNLCKACVLGVQYGMGEVTLGQRINKPPVFARELLRLHRETYPVFWRWSDAAVDHAMLLKNLHTVFGWTVHVADDDSNARSLRNFPMQANGAEMMRLACSLATERGIQVCAPVHDAILVEGPANTIKEVVENTQHAMQEASEIILKGFALRCDAKIVSYPGRYLDERGKKMWERVIEMLDLSDSLDIG
jgi:hypothetical protein